MKIGVMGAAGRMGRALTRAVVENEATELAGGIEHDGSPAIGQDLGTVAGLEPTGILITHDAAGLLKSCDAILDFTRPDASVRLAQLASNAGKIHIIGTTGFESSHEAEIRMAAEAGAVIVKAGNMSLGVNLLVAVTEKVAAALDDDFDIEILEMHHRHKVDAPSGTALMLGEAAAEGRDVSLSERSVRVRDGHTGARNRGDIGFATLRGGSVVGAHSVIFAGDGERVELTHVAEDRAIFARGAVKAALWARTRSPGLYSMMDVLGLT